MQLKGLKLGVNYARRQDQDGLTLIEIITALAIIGIAISFAVPSLQRIMADNRLSAQANSFVTALNVARSEAIRRGTRITVCKSGNGLSCDNTRQWEGGWLVFVDSSNTGVVDSGEQPLLVNAELDGDSTLRAKHNRLSNYISYLPKGASEGGPGPGSNDTLKLCAADATVRVISLNAVGRIRLSEGGETCP